MGLDVAGLKMALNNLFTATIEESTDEATSQEVFVNGLAAALEAFVQSAAIVYADGLEAPGGPVTGLFNGNLE
jgi:hypothetical protein